jgi:hypothetical protein
MSLGHKKGKVSLVEFDALMVITNFFSLVKFIEKQNKTQI